MEASKVKALFYRDVRYVIPSYQRAYSWEGQQREQFIEDLRDVSDKYYLGHFLFEKTDNGSVLCLIDGQQRLTTIVIFFSCLRHAFSKRFSTDGDTKKICDYIDRRYLRDQDTEQPHLATVENDNVFFIHEIIDRDSFDEMIDTSSKKRIRDCREYFDSVFEKESKDTLLKWLEIVEEATVTEYHVTKKSEAAQIFAFQNDRGKSLSNLEVLKSFFMLQIYLRGEKRQEEYVNDLNNSFSEIYESIVKTKVKEDDILRYFWMAFSKYGYNTENPLNEIKAYFKSKEIKEITLFAQLLSRAFIQVIAIEADQDFYMMNLRRLDRMAQSYPLLLKSKIMAKVEEKTYYRLVRLLENITFRAAARGGRAAIESRLNNILVNANDDQSFNSQIDVFISGIPYEYWSDKELQSALNSGGIYFNHRICSYLLWRYEQSLCPPNHPKERVRWEDIMKKESLEHIAPQTPKDEECAHGYGIYRDIENPENGIESGEWLHSIGNMLLASRKHNSSLGNKEFMEKLDSYGVANILMQQKELKESYGDVEKPLWDAAAIQTRGNKIIEAAMKIWDIKKVKAILPGVSNALF